MCARVWEGTGGPRAGVQQSAGPVSVHCESVEGADFPSVSLVVGVEETDVLFLKSVFSLQARSLEWTYQAGAHV